MKKLVLGLCFVMTMAFAGAAFADEPAILTNLNQNHAVQTADAVTLDAAQGAAYTMYRVYYTLNGGNYLTDKPRSEKFSNWRMTGESFVYQTPSVYGKIYTSAQSQLIWKENTNFAGTPWCTSR